LTCVAIAGAVALAACGGSSGGNATPAIRANVTPAITGTAATPGDPGGDDASPASLLLDRSDFPSDYLEKAYNAATDQNPLKSMCGDDLRRGVVAQATSSNHLFDGDSPLVNEVVLVYQDGAAAAEALGRVPVLVECGAASIRSGALNSGGVEYGDATVTQVTLGGASAGSTAFEIRASEAASAPGGGTSKVLTMLFAAKGRVLYEIFVSGSGESLDPDLLAEFGERAASRIPSAP
jgi:hypothetical protein